MNEKSNVDTVVSTAYMGLSPKMQDAVRKHDCFLTIAREESSRPIRIDGVLKIPEPIVYIMIDMTRGPIKEVEAFKAHTAALYNTFMKIEKWYKC